MKKWIDCDGFIWYQLLMNPRLCSRLKKAIDKINLGFQLTPFCAINSYILKKQTASIALDKNSVNMKKKGIKKTKLCTLLLFESPDKKQLQFICDNKVDSLRIRVSKGIELPEFKNFLDKFCDYVLKNCRKERG